MRQVGLVRYVLSTNLVRDVAKHAHERGGDTEPPMGGARDDTRRNSLTLWRFQLSDETGLDAGNGVSYGSLAVFQMRCFETSGNAFHADEPSVDECFK